MLLNNFQNINNLDKIKNENIYSIDEVEFIQKKFKMNFIDFKNNDITYEIINHDSKYYFFHVSVFEKILKTHKNPYNNKILNINIINRIYVKNQLYKFTLLLKMHINKFDFNKLYEEFINYERGFLKRLHYFFITFLISKNIKYNDINDNIILQISSNLNFELKQENDIEAIMGILGYLICTYIL